MLVLEPACVVRCWVKSRNERNEPLILVASIQLGHLKVTAGDKPEAAWVWDVKSLCPL